MKARAVSLSGLLEEAPCRLMLDESAVMQKNDVLREPSRLAHVMGHDNHFDAAVLGADEEPLDGERRSGIEAGGRLIEKKHLWIEAEGASKAEPLLLATGKHPCRCKSVALQPGKLQGLHAPVNSVRYAQCRASQARR